MLLAALNSKQSAYEVRSKELELKRAHLIQALQSTNETFLIKNNAFYDEQTALSELMSKMAHLADTSRDANYSGQREYAEVGGQLIPLSEWNKTKADSLALEIDEQRVLVKKRRVELDSVRLAIVADAEKTLRSDMDEMDKQSNAIKLLQEDLNIKTAALDKREAALLKETTAISHK